MSRRHAIQMTDDEVQAFLGEHRTAQVATVNRDGTVHLVTMWYGLLDGEIVMWTYAKSQKAHNLGRSANISCLVEAGDRYEELQGVSITGIAQLSDDHDYVRRVGEVVMLAPSSAADGDPIRQDVLEQTAAKRVAITVTPRKVASWDHRKLGGRY